MTVRCPYLPDALTYGSPRNIEKFRSVLPRFQWNKVLTKIHSHRWSEGTRKSPDHEMGRNPPSHSFRKSASFSDILSLG